MSIFIKLKYLARNEEMYQKAYDELLMIQNDYVYSLNICEAMES